MKEWLKNAVFYEIYPQSFNDTNSDGIGDFKGIIEKLDYIKDMGFTAIWMNPCFDSPFYDAGYDVRDYYKVAERYGTNEDLKNLFDEVHKRDMHLILDLVAAHTSIEHEWFKESMKAEKNKYSNRYIWTDSVYTDFVGITSINGGLKGISDRNGNCAVSYFSTQPALNYGFANVTEPWQCALDSDEAIATREELFNIIRFWLNMGCDGFRVDMAACLVKNDYDFSETIKLWQNIFSVINKEFPNAAFVSEWGTPEKALLGGFDMDFLLHFGPSHYIDMYHSEKPFFSAKGEGNAKDFFEYYVDVLKQTQGKGFVCIPSGNHDMERISYYCDATQIKLAYAFMMSMPGVPFVYYGDEIGMKYLPDLTSVEGGYFRTGTRTPMQWNNSVNSGFSTASPDKLYMMQDPDENRPTVEDQINDENSILNELKRQIQVRKNHVPLQESAAFELVTCDYPLVYKRYTDDACILIAINPMDTEQTIDIEDIKVKDVIYSFNGIASISDKHLTVPPLSASYLLLD